MNLDEAIKRLQKLRETLPGDTPVVWDAISHSYNANFIETRRSGRPVVLVNA